MRVYPLYILVCLLINTSCNETSSQKINETSEVSQNAKDITPKDIESLKFDDFTLSEDSKKALEDWQKYQELNDQISYIYKADFSFFNSEQKVLITFIKDFTTEMPESIKTAPILSRITALETMMLKLNSVLRLDNMDKSTKLKAVKEFLITMSNLNLQINKKFELDANLVQKNDTIE